MTKSKTFRKTKNKTSKKAVRKRTTKKKSFKRAKKASYDDILILLKDKKYGEIIEQLCKLIKDKKKRTDIITSLISSSKYRAYSIALKEFLYVAKEYRRTGSQELLQSYFKKLDATEAVDASLYTFNGIRKNVLKDMEEDNYSLSSLSLLDLNYNVTAGFEHSPKDYQFYIDCVATLVEEIWPGKGEALKVLYGNG